MANTKSNVEIKISTEVPASSQKAVQDLTAGFKGLDKASAGMSSSFGEFGSVASKAFGALSAGAVVLGAVGVAAKKALDFTLEGESIRATNAQFELLTKQAGVAGDALRKGLAGAADGLLDDTDVIEIANKALVSMGATAADLPPILAIARKATAVFGGELAENFESLSQAIATGQTKALKQLGIVIDSEDAYRDFAISVGVSADQLSEAGRQQAILNAVLSKGEASFRDVNVNIREGTDTLERLKVTIGEVAEVAVLAFEKTIGPSVRKYLDKIHEVAKDTKRVLEANFGEGAAKAEANVERLTAALNEAKAGLKDIEQEQRSTTDMATLMRMRFAVIALNKDVKEYEGQLAAAKAELAKYNVEQERSVAQTKAQERAFIDTKEAQRKLGDEGERIAKQLVMQDPRAKYQADVVALQAALEQKKIFEDEYFLAQAELAAQRDKATSAKYAAEAQLLIDQNQRLQEIDAYSNSQRIDDNNRRLNEILRSERLSAKDRERVSKDLAAAEQRVNQERLAATQGALGQAQQLFAENTAAYKVAASANALISAYEGANKAAAALAFAPPLAAAAAALFLANGLKNVAAINGVKLATGLTEVPAGYPNDTFPARLTSGERVVNVRQNQDLNEFMSDQGGNREILLAILAELRAGRQQPIPAVISDSAVFESVRSQIADGRRLA